MKIVKFFFIIFSCFIAMLLGIVLLINSHSDYSSFTDRVSHFFLSKVSVPASVRNYFSSFTIPKYNFVEEKKFIPLQYADLDFWAAHPRKLDGADVSPDGYNFDHQKNAPVDVFFVHPTTLTSAKNWNQIFQKNNIETKSRAIRYLQEWSLRDQASIFNSCCKIYAPFYRQATLAAFLSISGNGGKALDYAFEDVRAAFKFFRDNYNIDRPFIIVGHSQGSRHLIKLLKEEIIGTELMNRMIVAYTVGYPSKPISGLSICEKRAQVVCQISWNSQIRDVEERILDNNEICVNPLSWGEDNLRTGSERNLGSISFSEGKNLIKNLTGAECYKGRLLIDKIESNYFQYMPFGKGIYHHYDFSLFHMNIRKNIEERVDAFYKIGTQQRSF